MKPNPDKIYLIRGSTLAGLEDALRRRTPLPSNSDVAYRGPMGFTLPRGVGGGTGSPFSITVTAGEIFVAPGLVLPTQYYPDYPGMSGTTEPFGVPRSSSGGPRLDELPAPSCGSAPQGLDVIVHLVFECVVSVSLREGFITGGQVVDSWVHISSNRLPWRQRSADNWFFSFPIGRATRNEAVSLLNANVQPSFYGPVLNAPDVPPAAPELLPTMSLLVPVGAAI